ncbi:MAG: NADH-quinone oxidoreductase subunit M [Acidobacteria bacterium]|nr:NADH-quinone oxidoreductase subunit M [Acidobacteriota bacterium]
MYPVLTASTFLPLIGAALIFASPERLARWIALLTTLATLAVSAPLYLRFDKTSGALQFVENRPWIPSWNLVYGMGVDGISLPFILLSAIVSVLCVAVSWSAIQTRVRGFYAALLGAETAMIGLFAATNLFLFYVFWELTIVPMFFLIGVWGSTGRVYAAFKFLLFTLAGSVLMLVGLIVLLSTAGTLDFQALATTQLSLTAQAWLFVAFLAAFAVKVPMFPVHTWLPDAHTEAPTAGSVLLAGILLKMGAYGFLRISLPVFPDATQLFFKPMLVLSAVAIVYGAYVTLAQTDVKRLIAYSSVSHMGFVTLGIFSLDRSGLEGAILQMINHGIITGALFLCVGMIYERTHTRDIAHYGGLFKVAPIYSTFFALFCLAAAGMPGLNSFVGEFLIIVGALKVWPWVGAMAIWGVALGTAYVLWLYYRMVLGEANPRLQGLRLDLNVREIAILLPLAVFALVIGLHPESVLGFLRASVAHLLALMSSPGGIVGRL